MINSAVFSSQAGSNPQRIKITKRDNSPSAEQGKRSINIAETLQHEKAMAQAYRQKNERNIIKCRFLYNKLSALGNLQGVPQMIAGEVSEVDVKIKELELQLHFRRSQQMRKLRKKVTNFLQQINFQIQSEEMEKIEDQIELVLFLLDIFEEKFNEMTAERKEVNQIIARLEENSTLHPQESQLIKKENEQLNEKISILVGELNKLKNEDMKKLEADLLSKDQVLSNGSDAQLSLNEKNQELQKSSRRILELQEQLKDLEVRYQLLSGNLQRAKREETRWKERYRLMEAQKDQRIKILQDSVGKKAK